MSKKKTDKRIGTGATLVPEKRAELIRLLAKMDDEGFSWVVVALAERVWPDGLGGFRDRATIEATRREALRILKSGT